MLDPQGLENDIARQSGRSMFKVFHNTAQNTGSPSLPSPFIYIFAMGYRQTLGYPASIFILKKSTAVINNPHGF